MSTVSWRPPSVRFFLARRDAAEVAVRLEVKGAQWGPIIRAILEAPELVGRVRWDPDSFSFIYEPALHRAFVLWLHEDAYRLERPEGQEALL